MSVGRRYYRGSEFRRAKDIEELRQIARRRLPAFVAEYLEGGSEDEQTLTRNRDAFRDIRFVHRSLVDVSKRSLATSVFGQPCALPFGIGPTGFNGMFWKHGDLALARAARAARIPFVASTVSSDPLEEIAKETDRLWFQLYIYRDSAPVNAMLATAENVKCEALVVTVDAPLLGNRGWDQRSYARRFKLSWRAKLDVLMHLRWLFGVFLPRGLPGFGNLDKFLGGRKVALDSARYAGEQLHAGVQWDDIARLRDRWPRRLVIKGLLAPADIERAIALGADGVVLSNHGGRQLDAEAAPLDLLPAIVQLVNRRVTVMIDGGFRRGTDIVKALALGAEFVLLGRATLYGLAAGGEAGAAHALGILRAEVDRVLALLGCPSIAELGPSFLYGRHDSRVEPQPERIRVPILGSLG